MVIQGENDRFGNTEAIKEELAKHSVEADVVEVPKADHSYRNEQKEPVYQDATVELLVRKLRNL